MKYVSSVMHAAFVSAQGACALRRCPAGRLFGLGSVVLLSVACGEGRLLPVGHDEPELALLPEFEEGGRRPSLINSGFDDVDPSLTGDMLQIFFTSNRPVPFGRLDVDEGDENVWCAERRDRYAAFGEPRLVVAASSKVTETSAAVSLDGLTLWIGSERPHESHLAGDADIWRAKRAPEFRRLDRACNEGWEQPELEFALNSASKDIPRPLGLGESVMPLASRRHDGQVYLTYFAKRSGPGGSFGTPDLEGLDGLAPSGAMVDAFLSDDGRFLFFKNEDERVEDAPVNGDLMMAWRRSVDHAFSEPVPLAGINTAADERDPWLNPAGDRLFFSREGADGTYDLFGAKVALDLFQ